MPSGAALRSCIGSSVFIIFINDLCKVAKYAKPSLFADEFKITGDVSMQRNCDFMQTNVNAIADWSAASKLSINFEKSVALHYGKANPRWQYFINKHVIKSEKYVVDLGVCRNETFSYEEHIRRTAYKATKITGMVLKVFSARDTDFLKRVYSAYVRPTLEYVSSVWRSSSISLNAILGKVQRRYTKCMNGLKGVSYEKHLSVLGLQSLTQRLQYNDLVLTYKCLHGLLAITHESLGLVTPVTSPYTIERKVCVLCITSRSHVFCRSAFNQEFPIIVEQSTRCCCFVSHAGHIQISLNEKLLCKTLNLR